MKKQILGSDEGRAYRKAFQVAFAAALNETVAQVGLSPDRVEPQELDDPQSKGYALFGASRALAAMGKRTDAINAARDALTALEAFGDPQADECRSTLRLLEREPPDDLAGTLEA